MNNFIQLFIPEQREKLEPFPFQDFMYFDQNLFQVNNINDNNYIFNSDTIIEEIIFWLQHNNYVVVYADEYVIPFTRNYMRYHILHSQFIYGYDLEKKEFLSINFLNDESIGKLKICFDDLKKAIFSQSTKKLFEDSMAWNDRNTLHKIILIRYLENRSSFYDHGVNKEYIVNELKNYYESYNSSNYSCYFTGKLIGVWGMNIYSVIIDILKKVPKEIDYRMFHLLYEHKYFMIERFKLLDVDEEIINKLMTIYKNASILRMLCIKYNLKANETTAKKMIKIVDKMKNEEMIIFSEFFKLYNF